MNPGATTIIELARSLARPFTQYVVTVAFAVGMFMHLGIEVLTLAASLLAWHAAARSFDKRVEALASAGADAQAPAPAEPGAAPAG